MEQKVICCGMLRAVAQVVQWSRVVARVTIRNKSGGFTIYAFLEFLRNKTLFLVPDSSRYCGEKKYRRAGGGEGILDFSSLSTPPHIWHRDRGKKWSAYNQVNTVCYKATKVTKIS